MDSQNRTTGWARGNIKPGIRQGGATSTKTRIEQAEARTEQAETRTEQAKTRAEQAETRAEQAESRTEQAKTRTDQAEIRTEQAETRTEQAEMNLQRVVRREIDLPQEISPRLLKKLPSNGTADQKRPREQLTDRQRKILELIAGGKTNKEIAVVLGISTRTVEGHRESLMTKLNIHDTAGLTRYAISAGIIGSSAK